ncbi:MAG: ABC transporter substrate-binding protein [Rhodocyclales bacterium]|nr:ABC transporter substrate-binding protein [Rhodocyclales bacterium]
MTMKFGKTITTLLSVGALLGAAQAVQAADDQFVALPSYRVGPYGNNGISLYGGMIDYMQLVNMKGGVNGVKFSWEECETEYNNARGVECYERLKTKSPTKGTMIHPLSTGISYSILDKTAADKVPLVMIGYGRTDAIDGSIFPYAFPLVTTYQMQASAMLVFMAQRDGGKTPADLKGKKIAFIYHDSAFGKEPLEVLRAESALNKFEVVEIPVAHPGIEQTAQWQQVRQHKPDWVIFWGWGAMNSAGLQAAQKVGFPRDRMVGVWWSGSEEDTVPAGPGAKNYMAANFGKTGKDLPVIQEILKTVYGANKGNMKDQSKIGSVLYSRGIIHGIITVEAVKKAQEKFGKRVVSGEEVQWGLEHLKIDQAMLKALGAEGMMPDINVTCADHEGSGKVLFQQWDGNKWTPITGYIEGNRKLVRQLLDASAKKYAEDKKITPRDCSKVDVAAATTKKK